MQLRLWGSHLSPFAGRVHVALVEKGILDEVELVEISLRTRPTRMFELNPNGRVPVLEVDGYALRESQNICDWLEDAYPEPALWPADPTERAHGRGLARWLESEVVSAFFGGMRAAAFGLRDGDPEDLVERLFGRLG